MARDTLIDLLIGKRYTNIAHIRLTSRMAEGEDLVPGGACAAVLEAELYGETPIERGRELKYFHDNLSQGIFRVEESRQVSKNRYKITCYDRMVAFDRDVTALWNSFLPGWADYALDDLCDALGVRLEEFDMPLEKLSPIEGVSFTGRQLLKWLGQRWGLCFRFGGNGGLTGYWLSSSEKPLGDYRMDGLTEATYDTAPVERVWVRNSEADVGLVHPDGLESTANTLIIQGNPIAPEPQTLYEKLKNFTYRPFRCAALTAPNLGTVVTLPGGAKGPVMERVLEDSVWTIAATGNPALQSTEAWNSLDFADMGGRMLTLEKSGEGLRMAASDGEARLTQLEVTSEGLTSRVEQTEGELGSKAEASAVKGLRSELTQRADSLEFSVTQVRTGLADKADAEGLREVTEHFRFDMDGLTITNSGTGMGIGLSEQRVIFTGGENPTTVIYPSSMETAAMTVHSTLTLGAWSLIPRTNGNLSLRCTGAN